MKDAKYLVWLTQLGLSVAAPLICFILLAVWIKDTLALGNWVLWVGIGLGGISAVSGLLHSLNQLMDASDQDQEDPPVSFNDHT